MPVDLLAAKAVMEATEDILHDRDGSCDDQFDDIDDLIF